MPLLSYLSRGCLFLLLYFLCHHWARDQDGSWQPFECSNRLTFRLAGYFKHNFQTCYITLLCHLLIDVQSHNVFSFIWEFHDKVRGWHYGSKLVERRSAKKDVVWSVNVKTDVPNLYYLVLSTPLTKFDV